MFTREQERVIPVDQLMKLRPKREALALLPSHELQELFGVEEEE